MSDEAMAKAALHEAADRILHGYSPHVCSALWRATTDAEAHRTAKKLIEPFRPTIAEVDWRKWITTGWYGDSDNPNAQAERLLMIAFALTMPKELR